MEVMLDINDHMFTKRFLKDDNIEALIDKISKENNLILNNFNGCF